VKHGVLLALCDGHRLVCVVGQDQDGLETSTLADGPSAEELDEKTGLTRLDARASEIVLDTVGPTSVPLQE